MARTAVDPKTAEQIRVRLRRFVTEHHGDDWDAFRRKTKPTAD